VVLDSILKSGGVNLKQKKPWFQLLSFILMFSVFLGACSSSSTSTDDESSGSGSSGESAGSKEEAGKPQQGGDLIVGSTGAPTNFNDLYSTDTSSGELTNMMFDTLVGIDKEFNPIPKLAKKWEISDDGLTYTFHLRDDVKWHDGKKFTAEDVVFTFKIPLSEEYNGQRASSFEMIKEVKATDDYTVKMTLKYPFAPFMQDAANSYNILPKHILKDVPIAKLGEHEFNTKNPTGTGPFKFKEWKEGQYVKVVANEDYYGGRSYLDSVTYKIVPDANSILAQFKAGDIDYIDVQATQLPSVQPMVDQGKVEMQTSLALQYNYIGWNLRNPLFEDKKVRQALTHALDRKKIIEAVLNGDGKVAHAPGSPLSWAYNPDVPKFEYDPEKAKKMLAEAGWKDTDGDGILDKDGKKFSFTLKTNQGNEEREQIAVVVQQMLKEVGIEVTPKLVEWSAFVEVISPPNWDFEAIVLGWALGTDPDPTDIWHTKEIENGLNNIAYSNKKLDELMEKNTKIVEQEKRAEVIGKIMAGIAEDQPYTFLYYPNQHIAYTPNLHDVELHPRLSYYNIEKWWLEK
jgi:peptide/nickel transport system substrate-binding protein